MSTAADDQFYREYILDHFKNPRNYGRLESPDISHEEDNPLCGDVVGMDFRVRDGVIEDIRFHGRGCAISSLGITPDRAAEGPGPRGRQEDQQGRRARRAGDRDLSGANQVRSALAQSVESRRLWIGGRR